MTIGLILHGVRAKKLDVTLLFVGFSETFDSIFRRKGMVSKKKKKKKKKKKNCHSLKYVLPYLPTPPLGHSRIGHKVNF